MDARKFLTLDLNPDFESLNLFWSFPLIILPFVLIPGCWNRPAAAAAIFSARPRKRQARGASSPTISLSWAQPSSAISTAPTTQMLPCRHAATSPVMIHTNACLASPMPHPPKTREITCAAISPSAGDRQSRRYHRLRRARPAATRRRESPTAMSATAATRPMIWQVRARGERGSGSEVCPGMDNSGLFTFPR